MPHGTDVHKCEICFPREVCLDKKVSTVRVQNQTMQKGGERSGIYKRVMQRKGEKSGFAVIDDGRDFPEEVIDGH
jgi:hypothetical protein